jgi:hypothetical protein
MTEIPNQTIEPEEKLSRYLLGKRLQEGCGDLTAAEVVLLKQCVAALFSPLVYGQIVTVLDPASIR